MLLIIRTHVHIRVHILRVNFQVSNQSDRVDTDAQIVQHRWGGNALLFLEKKKKDLHEKNREEKLFRVYNPNTVSWKGKEKKVLHKTISKSIHHGEFIRRVARTNLEQYA